MEDGDLGDRVEGSATRLVDEHVILGNGRDDVRSDEITNQVAGRRIVDVRRRDTGGVAVLGEKFIFGLFVVGTRVVARIRISHDESRQAR